MVAYGNEISVICSIAVFCVVAYLLGSINFAIIFTRIFSNTDIRDHGSGNAGMTNVMRTSGKKPAILTFICDFLKGVIAVLLAKYLYTFLADFFYNIGIATASPLSFLPNAKSIISPDVVGYIVAIFCLIGHMFPVFFKFKGGKGVATTAGIVCTLAPYPACFCLATFIVLVLSTKIVSISSIITVILTVPLTYIFFNDKTEYLFFGTHQNIVVTVLMAIMAIMVIAKHHENIKRLISGNENKFGSKKKGQNK